MFYQNNLTPEDTKLVEKHMQDTSAMWFIYDRRDQLIMSAPLWAIAAIFDLQDLAILRIIRQTLPRYGVCNVLFPGRTPPIGLEAIKIRRAMTLRNSSGRGREHEEAQMSA